MLTFESRFEQIATGLIEARIADISAMIADGQLPDHGEYLRHTGRILGLREALELFSEANKQLQER